jgi:hypothetical protein
MSNPYIAWLNERTQLPGVLACGVGFPDKTAASRSYSPGFPAECLDKTWRYVRDMFQVAGLHRFKAHQARWIYERAQLCCVMRPDHLLFCAFIEVDLKPEVAAAVAELFAEFKKL